MIWAAANGIVEGMEEGVFAPERAVTRQQVAVILYRHSGAEAGNEDLLSSYPDGKQVAPYARQIRRMVSSTRPTSAPQQRSCSPIVIA